MNRELLERMVLEMAEGVMNLDQVNNPVMISIFSQREGTTTRWDPDWKFHTLKNFIHTKRMLYRAHWGILRREVKPRFLIWLWYLEWLAHYLAGHFKGSRLAVAARATAVPAHLGETPPDASEASEEPSAAPGATVLRFPLTRTKR
jgi:hypothetical protein